jgi:hypothetical protein
VNTKQTKYPWLRTSILNTTPNKKEICSLWEDVVKDKNQVINICYETSRIYHSFYIIYSRNWNKTFLYGKLDDQSAKSVHTLDPCFCLLQWFVVPAHSQFDNHLFPWKQHNFNDNRWKERSICITPFVTSLNRWISTYLFLNETILNNQIIYL